MIQANLVNLRPSNHPFPSFCDRIDRQCVFLDKFEVRDVCFSRLFLQPMAKHFQERIIN